jgi:Domain of unknown function (DUF4398)
MKTTHISFLSLAMVAGFLNACATTTTDVPGILELARLSDATARSGLPAKLAPRELSAAEQALGRANQECARKGDTDACRDLAYIAENKLELATAVAQTNLDRAAHGSNETSPGPL